MDRRNFLAAMGAVAACGMAPPRSTSGRPPRKVIVGALMQSFWGKYPGLERRLAELESLVDRVAAESLRRYGRSPDLLALPEAAITGEVGSDALANSVPLEGPVRQVFSAKAREHRCYIVVPTYLLESREKKLCTNAAILMDRSGEVAGIYRKIHLVTSLKTGVMEGGCTPGREAPVFECDFGKLGIQICYDMEFDHGWNELARQGAELIVWPTQSPQTSHPAARAMQQRCYIVSSTWRNNASVFEPTGKIAAQVRPPEGTLVHELDLSYAILPWSSRLEKGEALRRMFGPRIGYRYYEDEDCGIFWSNDPAVPVGEMVRALGVLEAEDELARVRQFYRKAGLPGY